MIAGIHWYSGDFLLLFFMLFQYVTRRTNLEFYFLFVQIVESRI